jgi:hypothetical protein
VQYFNPLHLPLAVALSFALVITGFSLWWWRWFRSTICIILARMNAPKKVDLGILFSTAPVYHSLHEETFKKIVHYTSSH